MTPLQDKHLKCIYQRLENLFSKAEHRYAQYSLPSPEQKIDHAFVTHMQAALEEIRTFQRAAEHHTANQTSYLKDAVLQLHALSIVLNETIKDVRGPFMGKLFKEQAEELRAITVALVGLLVNVCAHHIRHSMGTLQKNMERLAEMDGTTGPYSSRHERPYLKVVK